MLPEASIPGHPFEAHYERAIEDGSPIRAFMGMSPSLLSGAEIVEGVLPFDSPTTGLPAGIPGVEILSSGPSRSGQFLVERARDLYVAALGGSVEIHRRWDGQQWVFHPALQDLNLAVLPTSGEVVLIERFGLEYERESATSNFYRSAAGDRIENTGSGFSYEDIDGFRVSYDVSGQAIAFAQRGSPSITLTRGPDGITAFVDVNSVSVVTIEYTGGRVSAVQDHTGRRVEYEYTNGLLTKVTDVLDHEWDYAYVPDGGDGHRMTSRTDPEGNTTNFGYDVNGRLNAKTFPGGSRVKYAYGYDAGKREHYRRIEYPENRIVETWFDHSGLVIRVDLNGRTVERWEEAGTTRRWFDEHGNLTQIVRDAQGRVTSTILPDGSSTTISYDPNTGLASRVVDARGIETHFAYTTAGLPQSFTEGVGTPSERTVQVTYDANGQIDQITQVVPGGTNRTSGFTYDAFGNIATYTDWEDEVWTYEYDALGQTTSSRNPLTHEWRWAYNDAGSLISQTSPTTESVAYAYDKVGNLLQVTDAETGIWQFAYDATDRVVLQRNPKLEEWTYGYTSGGLLRSVTAPGGAIWTIEWDRDAVPVLYTDPVGTQVSMRLELGNTVTNPGTGWLFVADYGEYEEQQFYDFANRATRRLKTGDDGSVEDVAYTHDATGNLIGVTRTDGASVSYGYDALSRLNLITDLLDQDTQVLNDLWSSQVTVTEPAGRQTTWAYDKNGRLISETRDGAGTSSFEYDAAGNMTRHDHPDGKRVEYDYDAADRIVELRAYPDGVSTTPSETATFGYDDNGLLVSFSNAAVSTSMTRDEVGRTLQVSTTYPGFTKSHSYAYSPDGTVSSVTGTSGRVSTFQYDGAGRLVAASTTNEGSVAFGPYQLRQPLRVALPGGTTNEIEWSSLGELKSSIARDSANEVVASSVYSLDSNGAPASLATEAGTTTYTLDPEQRVLQATGAPLPDEDWTFDLAGNRQPATGTPWQYGAAGELLVADSDTHVYDGNGNRTQTTRGPDRILYEYDDRNRLTRVSEGPIGSEVEVASFGYDALGRRVWVEASGTRTYLHHHAEGVGAEIDATGTVLRTFVYEPEALHGRGLISQASGASTQYFKRDRNGRGAAMISGSGGLVWRAHYSSVGADQISNATESTPMRLPGQYAATGSGLRLEGHRVFDPVSGQYLQPDPVGSFGSRYRYAYADNRGLVDAEVLGLALPVFVAPVAALIARHGAKKAFAILARFARTKLRKVPWGPLGNALSIGDLLNSCGPFIDPCEWSGRQAEKCALAGAGAGLGFVVGGVPGFAIGVGGIIGGNLIDRFRPERPVFREPLQ